MLPGASGFQKGEVGVEVLGWLLELVGLLVVGVEVSLVGLLVLGVEFEELLDEVGSLVGSWVSEVSEVSLEVSEFEEPSPCDD